MIKTRDYFMHQTPRKLAKDLIADIDFTNIKNIYEPFAGENAFYDNLSQLSFSHKYNIALTNMYTDLDNQNKMLIEELNSKNEYIKELEERLR